MRSICRTLLLKRVRLLSVNGGIFGKKEDPPVCSYIIQSYDTAFSKGDRADYSAITTWGIFLEENSDEEHIILLDAVKGRLGVS